MGEAEPVQSDPGYRVGQQESGDVLTAWRRHMAALVEVANEWRACFYAVPLDSGIGGGLAYDFFRFLQRPHVA